MAATVPLATQASIPLPPGFRFLPTDEELVVHYLHRRAMNRPLPSEHITDKDILNHNPWDVVPENATEKYFFNRRVVRWQNGTRWKRSTEEGYWKTSGKEVPIFSSGISGGIHSRVGLKRTLVFYHGKPPVGKHTNWVMKEYSLAGAGLAPYPLMRPCTRSNSIGNGRCNADVVGKEPGDPAGTLPCTSASVQNATVMVNPDMSWVICRICKKKKGMPRVNVHGYSNAGGQRVPFFDFFGLGKNDGTSSSSRQTVSLLGMENHEDGRAGSNEDLRTGDGK